MSLDVRKHALSQSSGFSNSDLTDEFPDAKDQWKTLRKKVRVRAEKQSARNVFGDAAKKGNVYRWGVAASQQGPCSEWWEVLSRLATNSALSKKQISRIDFDQQVQRISQRLSHVNNSVVDETELVVLTAALPGLIDHLDYRKWWDLIGELHRYREMVLEAADPASASALIVGGEVGLTFAWCLRDLPSCARLQESAFESVAQWCKHEEDSIASAISGGINTRLGCASLIRCRSLIEGTTRRKFRKQLINVLADLATWTTALTMHTGGSAFSTASAKDVKDDTAKSGLLHAVVQCDPDTLKPAMGAARGETQSGGRLAWEISLPEAIHHCDQSKIAVLMPQWDVRRGRVHLDYSQKNFRVEVFAGKSTIVSGDWETSIEHDGSELQPQSEWISTCEYSDDDVHYLEFEQSWTGRMILQRQVLVIRDDRCVMLADSVLPAGSQTDRPGSSEIRYSCRLPIPQATTANPEEETREVMFGEKKSQCMMIPLSASEWRVGQTSATLRVTDDHHLLLTANSKGALYAPLWMDMQRRRLKRKRTWRQLTVADELRIVGKAEAVGYRVQAGSEQWMLYRSLGQSRCRSVMGKHLVADFYAARFHASDGSFEEVVTVDEDDMG